MAAPGPFSELSQGIPTTSTRIVGNHSPSYEEFSSPDFTMEGAHKDWPNAKHLSPESSLSTLEGNRELSFEDVLAAATSAQVDVSNGLEFDSVQFERDFGLDMGDISGYSGNLGVGIEDIARPAASNSTNASPNVSGLQVYGSRTPMEDKACFLDILDHQEGTLQSFEAGRWSQALSYKHRIIVERFIDPELDTTIGDVLRDREHWVQEMCNAIVNVDDVCDHPDSRERKRFVKGAYDAEQIPVVARIIFIALLDQVFHGYRGTREASLRPHVAQQDDKNGNCLVRIQNVVTALKNDKRVCKDVLDDESRIGDLVYAPLMVARKKVFYADNNVRRIKQKEAKDQKLQELEAKLEQGAGPLEKDDDSFEIHNPTLTIPSDPKATSEKETSGFECTPITTPSGSEQRPAKRGRGRPRKDTTSQMTSTIARPAPQTGRRNKRKASTSGTAENLSTRTRKAPSATEPIPQARLPDMNKFTDMTAWADASLATMKDEASGSAQLEDEASG